MGNHDEFLEKQEKSKLGLSVRQINNLCTGIKLAAELKSEEFNLRKFITIHGYSYDGTGKRIKLRNVLNYSNIISQIYFELHYYEISIEYYINNWDVTEDDLVNAVYKDDISGIENLEVELLNYIQDFSVLKPEWYCENLL